MSTNNLLMNLIFAMVGLIMAIAVGFYLIPYIKRLKLGQHERLEGPGSHLVKEGTPTFGGFIFLIPFFLLSCIYIGMQIVNGTTWPRDLVVALVAIFLSALLGFYDDYVKVRVDKEGLSPRQKSKFLVLIFAVYALYYVFFSEQAAWHLVGFEIPFYGFVSLDSQILRALFALFIVFYLYCCSNAVNITDGVDGLCSLVTLIVLVVSTMIVQTSNQFAGTEMANSWTVVITILEAGLLGFLFFNRYPARIFMGDLGSLALGTTVAIYLLQFGKLFAFLIVGIIYWLEILSVLIQVLYFKKTGGKRIFKMTPIHHHFELSNWSETKIVGVFSLVTMLGGILTFLLFRA